MLLDCYKVRVGDVKMNVSADGGGGWLLCDGSYHSKLAYPELYALLVGKTPETTEEFAVPDLSLRSPMGVGSGLDVLAESGESEHTLTASEMPTHNHGMASHQHTVEQHNHTMALHNHSINAHDHFLENIVIPARSNSAAGSGSRLMRANNTGTQDDLTVDVSAFETSADALTTQNQAEGGVTGLSASDLMTGFASGTTADAGAGDAHNIVHPVFGVYYHIFAGCVISEGDC